MGRSGGKGNRAYQREQRDDHFSSWTPEKQLAATFYALQNLAPEDLDRVQYGKLTDMCKWWVRDAQCTAVTRCPQDEAKAGEEWSRAVDILRSVDVRPIPRKLFAQLRLVVKELENDMRQEEGRRYREQDWSRSDSDSSEEPEEEDTSPPKGPQGSSPSKRSRPESEKEDRQEPALKAAKKEHQKAGKQEDRHERAQKAKVKKEPNKKRLRGR